MPLLGGVGTVIRHVRFIVQLQIPGNRNEGNEGNEGNEKRVHTHFRVRTNGCAMKKDNRYQLVLIPR